MKYRLLKHDQVFEKDHPLRDKWGFLLQFGDIPFSLAEIQTYNIFKRHIDEFADLGLLTLNAANDNQPRKCLSCGKTFQSTWIGNRICGSCKSGVMF